MAIRCNLEQFPTAYPAKVAAREGMGHMYSLQHSEDLWNGAIVTKGDYVSLDLYKEGVAATAVNAKVVDRAANGNYYVEFTEDVPATQALIVYNPPVIEEQYNKTFQKETNFYIPASMEARAYPIFAGDIWEFSEDSFSQTPTVGTTTITAVADKKMTVA